MKLKLYIIPYSQKTTQNGQGSKCDLLNHASTKKNNTSKFFNFCVGKGSKSKSNKRIYLNIFDNIKKVSKNWPG